ncbi:MAG: bifunctional tetrahydrofolate synthase/dihydrofolate synthase [Candidatus Symbiodolus clandestinus]
MMNLGIPTATASLTTWLDYLRQRYHQRIDLGLKRIARVAQALDLDQPLALQVVTVAGTNGKGTTCCTLEKIWLAAGYRVGVYSSPHLLRYTERVRIQGHEPADSAYTAAFWRVEQARLDQGVTLTFFEYTTLVSFHLFRQAALDVVILEVGLGGRLDAVNLIDPDIAVITTIALDHTQWLGSTREAIGYEKAGILRSQKPAIIGELAMPNSIAEYAKQQSIPLFRREIDWFFEQQSKAWSWYDRQTCLTNLPLPQVPLANAATALAVLPHSPLIVSHRAICQGLQQALLPGRFQTLQRYPQRLIVDVAHNPHAAAYLVEQLRILRQQQPQLKQLHAVVGMLADKDIPGTLEQLLSEVDYWYCGALEGEGVRCGPVDRLLAQLPTATTQAFINPVQAWRQAMLNAQAEDIVLVFGSFHTVGDVIAAFSPHAAIA